MWLFVWESGERFVLHGQAKRINRLQATKTTDQKEEEEESGELKRLPECRSECARKESRPNHRSSAWWRSAALAVDSAGRWFAQTRYSSNECTILLVVIVSRSCWTTHTCKSRNLCVESSRWTTRRPKCKCASCPIWSRVSFRSWLAVWKKSPRRMNEIGFCSLFIRDSFISSFSLSPLVSICISRMSTKKVLE